MGAGFPVSQNRPPSPSPHRRTRIIVFPRTDYRTDTDRFSILAAPALILISGRALTNDVDIRGLEQLSFAPRFGLPFA